MTGRGRPTGRGEEALRACGASDPIPEELAEYLESPYQLEESAGEPELPLPDEPHVEAWRGYEREAAARGAIEALASVFVQLRFPIAEGISDDPRYRRATRRGEFEHAEDYGSALELEAPNDLRLEVRESLGGSVPILVTTTRNDFVTMVRAFLCRNEPAPIPDSMGACLVKGLNNWDRVWTYRREWAAGRQEPPSEPEWKQEFKQLLARRELYQDRLVILSDGPYSGVDAGDLGLGTEQWKADSLAIRREHELAHYFVYRVFGSLRQNVQDELIADFVGLVRAYGRYRPEMALRFLGLERFPRTRADGRIENYRGDPALSDPAMAVVRCLAHRAAANLGRLSDREGDELKAPSRLARITLTLAGLSLDQLAADDFLERLDAPSRG